MALVIAAVGNLLISSWFDTPKINNIRRDNNRLEREYEILLDKIRSEELTLSDIKHRDHFVYRPLLGIDTLDIPRVYSDYNDTKYETFNSME
jgi:hypothetical protein